jgi:hypothetical protein
MVFKDYFGFDDENGEERKTGWELTAVARARMEKWRVTFLRSRHTTMDVCSLLKPLAYLTPLQTCDPKPLLQEYTAFS